MNTLFTPFLILFFLCFPPLIGLIMYEIFVRMLRERHPNKWRELGKPSLLTNNGIFNGFNVLMFLFKKEYKLLGDERLSKFANILRLFNFCYLGFFSIALIVFLSIFIGRN